MPSESIEFDEDAMWGQCPCCDYFSLPDRHDNNICPVCNWEDDGQDIFDLDVQSDCNDGITLREARRNYRNFGACLGEAVSNVIAPDERGRYVHCPRNTSEEKILLLRTLIAEGGRVAKYVTIHDGIDDDEIDRHPGSERIPEEYRQFLSFTNGMTIHDVTLHDPERLDDLYSVVENTLDVVNLFPFATDRDGCIFCIAGDGSVCWNQSPNNSNFVHVDDSLDSFIDDMLLNAYHFPELNPDSDPERPPGNCLHGFDWDLPDDFERFIQEPGAECTWYSSKYPFLEGTEVVLGPCKLTNTTGERYTHYSLQISMPEDDESEMIVSRLDFPLRFVSNDKLEAPAEEIVDFDPESGIISFDLGNSLFRYTLGTPQQISDDENESEDAIAAADDEPGDPTICSYCELEGEIDSYFCTQCGAPLDTGLQDPMELINAERKLYLASKNVSPELRKLLVALIILVPIVLMAWFAVALFGETFRKNVSEDGFGTKVFLIFIVIIGILGGVVCIYGKVLARKTVGFSERDFGSKEKLKYLDGCSPSDVKILEVVCINCRNSGYFSVVFKNTAQPCPHCGIEYEVK